MAASGNGAGAGVAVKVVSVREDNRTRSLPTIRSSALWIDGETGEVAALIDGEALTAIRTGAAAGVATDLLAPAMRARSR